MVWLDGVLCDRSIQSSGLRSCPNSPSQNRRRSVYIRRQTTAAPFRARWFIGGYARQSALEHSCSNHRSYLSILWFCISCDENRTVSAYQYDIFACFKPVRLSSSQDVFA
ncbi:hypothetical protein CCHR01_18525 [Colletotrichum chrysophilum]|uniref:Uncharacterized protein n=1 Tax=Colletotrichum chrysophilum TaxID=1836956 RepID=A0AAD9A0K8_9PEZI|nr:hypothetical protein CCHR01_18525 [Colletotrichum chrysophilum]